MDDDRLRMLGLMGGGGALVIALGIVALGGPDKSVQEKPAAAPAAVSAEPSMSASAPIPDVEPAMAEPSMTDPPRAVAIPKTLPAASPDVPARNPNLEFIVRFDDRHPMSRAQGLYLQGKHAEAAAAARNILAQRSELAGLCFVRFTLGAELVLAHCARVPRAQVQRTSERWLRRLRATKGVQYADANVIVQPEGK
jgi:hypothetical protein